MRMIGGKIELFVDDLARSTDFYRDALGFEVGETRFAERDGVQLAHVPVWNGGIVIGLGLHDHHHFRRGRGAEDLRGIGTELCFYAEPAELEDWHERARAHAGSGFEPLELRPWGARDFRVVDPDGYYLRISEPDKDHPEYGDGRATQAS